MSGSIVPYSDSVADYTSHVPCSGTQGIFIWMKARVGGEGHRGEACQVSSFAHSCRLSALLLPALCPGKLVSVDGHSLISGLQLSLAKGKPSLPPGDQRVAGGGGWVVISPVLSSQGYFGSTVSTEQRPLVLSRWPSLHSASHPATVNTSFLFSHGPRD